MTENGARSPEVARCGAAETVPLGGGARMVRACPRPATDEVDGEQLCRMHADAKRYDKREFERLMTLATRHSRSVAIHNKGVWCSCGTFVPDGELHHWNVPSVVEDRLEDLLAKMPLSSFSPEVQEAVAAFHNGSSHPLLDELAEECREIEREMRDA